MQASRRLNPGGRHLGCLVLSILAASCEPSDHDHPGASEPQSLRTDDINRPRRFALVLVDLGQGVNLSVADARRTLLGAAPGDRSIREYYLEVSYGRQDLVGEVVGPLDYRMSGCDVAGLARDLRPRVPGTFDHYLWYLGSRVSACPWSGLGQSGSPGAPATDTWYNANATCVDYVQEPAHNLGMKHSSFMLCGGERFNDNPQRNCTNAENGDVYDPLGNGCRHFNGYQKAFLGWIGGCNLVEVRSRVTLPLLPLELACHGTQVLMVPMPRKRSFVRKGGGPEAVTELTHYYLEFRSSRGLDRGLRPGVQVRVSGDVRDRDRALNTWILDMNPATSEPDALLAGESFSDPAGGLTIRVESLDSSRAVVKVDLTGGEGGPLCADGSLLAVAPGPESCAATPTTPQTVPPSADAGISPADAAIGTPLDVALDLRQLADAQVPNPRGTDTITGACSCRLQPRARPDRPLLPALLLLLGVVHRVVRRAVSRRPTHE